MIALETVGGSPRAAHPSLQTTRFPVTGMTCSTCVNRITRAVKPLPGVSAVRVDLGDEAAIVRRDPEVATDASIAAAIEAAGYGVDLEAASAVDATQVLGPLQRWLRRRTA